MPDLDVRPWSTPSTSLPSARPPQRECLDQMLRRQIRLPAASGQIDFDFLKIVFSRPGNLDMRRHGGASAEFVCREERREVEYRKTTYCNVDIFYLVFR